jgi:hypothetical protein
MAIRLLVCSQRTVIPNVYKLYHGNGLLGFLYKLFFSNPILFAMCTVTFNKLCNVVEACRGALSSTPPYLTGSRPRVSVGNKS